MKLTIEELFESDEFENIIDEKWVNQFNKKGNLQTDTKKAIITKLSKYYASAEYIRGTKKAKAGFEIGDKLNAELSNADMIINNIKKSNITKYNFASNAWNVIVSVFSAVGGWFSGVFSGVSSAVGNVFSGFGRFAQDAWNGITSVFGNVGKWFSDIFDGIGKTVSNVFKGITDTIEKVTGTISGITDKVKGFFGGGSVVLQREFADLKARGLTQNSSNVQNKYENSFTINAGNNQDPTAIARAVRREFELGRA